MTIIHPLTPEILAWLDMQRPGAAAVLQAHSVQECTEHHEPASPRFALRIASVHRFTEEEKARANSDRQIDTWDLVFVFDGESLAWRMARPEVRDALAPGWSEAYARCTRLIRRLEAVVHDEMASPWQMLTPAEQAGARQLAAIFYDSLFRLLHGGSDK